MAVTDWIGTAHSACSIWIRRQFYFLTSGRGAAMRGLVAHHRKSSWTCLVRVPSTACRECYTSGILEFRWINKPHNQTTHRFVANRSRIHPTGAAFSSCWTLMRPPFSLLCSTLLPSMLRHAPEYLAMIFHDVRWAEPNHDVSATLHPNGSWHRQWWAAYFCEASHMAAKAGNCMYLLTDALPCFLHLVWHDLTLRRNCQRWPLSALNLGMHGIQKLKVKDRKSAITVYFYFYGLLLLLLLLLLLWLLPLWRSPLDIMDFRASHQGFFLLSGGGWGCCQTSSVKNSCHATWGLRSTPCRAGWNAEEHQPLYRRHQLWWVLAE